MCIICPQLNTTTIRQYNESSSRIIYKNLDKDLLDKQITRQQESHLELNGQFVSRTY